MQSLITQIVDVARGFVGQSEIPDNRGFRDPQFQKQMILAGWQRGQSWCSYALEVIFRTALLRAGRPKLWANLEPLFSGSVLETLRRLRAKGYTVKDTPSVGDLVFWQHGSSPFGHIGLVVALGSPGSHKFESIEGNTSGMVTDKITGAAEKRGDVDAIVRNGDGVYPKIRLYNEKAKTGSFRLLGFVSVVRG